MSNHDKAAIVFNSAVMALIESMGMHAENEQRRVTGASMAYVEDSFLKVITRHGLRNAHNFILEDK